MPFEEGRRYFFRKTVALGQVVPSPRSWPGSTRASPPTSVNSPAVVMATRSYREGKKLYWDREAEEIVEREPAASPPR